MTDELDAAHIDPRVIARSRQILALAEIAKENGVESFKYITPEIKAHYYNEGNIELQRVENSGDSKDAGNSIVIEQVPSSSMVSGEEGATAIRMQEYYNLDERQIAGIAGALANFSHFEYAKLKLEGNQEAARELFQPVADVLKQNFQKTGINIKDIERLYNEQLTLVDERIISQAESYLKQPDESLSLDATVSGKPPLQQDRGVV